MVELKLTKRQQEIFDFIGRYAGKYGYPPTVREIGKAVGLASSSTVHAHLANLQKSGLLKRNPTKPRAIEVMLDHRSGLVDEGLQLNVLRVVLRSGRRLQNLLVGRHFMIDVRLVPRCALRRVVE